MKIARVFCFAVSTVLVVPMAVRADDSAAITAAVTKYYLANMFQSVNWQNVSITEVPPYAVFTALNGPTSIDPLVQDVNGTWQVEVPSKGPLTSGYLYQAIGIPLSTADELTGIGCTPEPRHNEDALRPFDRMPFNRPTYLVHHTSRNRLVRVKFTKVFVPATPVRLFSKPRGRWVSTVLKAQTVAECLL